MNIVIWLQNFTPQGGGVEFLNPAVQILARLYGKVDALGVISDIGISLNGVQNIKPTDLQNLDYDLILVTGKNASLVPILNLGIDTEKVVLDRTVCVPFFTLEKYNKLRRSKLSILSQNCWGGLSYHRFGLPFLTPTVNMFFSAKEFLTFLKNPIEKLKIIPSFKENRIEPHAKTIYPVLSLGNDINLHMNHYPNAETAINTWKKRSVRVNFFNALAMTYTEDKEILAEFDKLPYAKKVCFVPFQSELDSAYFIDTSKYNFKEFWRPVNETATGGIIEYDLWDMLLYGKKTPLRFK